jgi:hypothetical protein
VATALRFLHDRFRGRRRWGLQDLATGLQVDLRTARRALHAAELAELLVVEREPGCKLRVRIGEPTPRPAEIGRRPLYGPIPWAWWLPAIRLPQPAPRTAAACWLTAGWERSAEFEFSTGEWAELALSRAAARRGLLALVENNMVEIGPGRGVVRLREVSISPSGALVTA